MSAAMTQRPSSTPTTAGGARPLRLAVVSHLAYGALSGGRGGRLVGGVEWQTSLTAKWMASRGHQVSMIVWDEGQPDGEIIDGVRVIKTCREDAGVPVVRFFHPRWSKLVQALKEADADVYYHNCGEYVTGQIALWCRRHGRGFLYSVASDPDCDARLPEMKSRRERMLYRYGLTRADEVVVQTRNQQRMLESGFRRGSTVIPMPCVGPTDEQFIAPPPPTPETFRVLWAGRVLPLKRMEWLLDAAESLPEVQFDVAGPPDPETDYTRGLFERGRSLRNVRMLGRVDRSAMPELYRRASCLVCTSTFEGFPNTFLEAWSHGVPVVTTVDPDGLVAERGLGVVFTDVAGLVSSIHGLRSNTASWQAASQRGRAYFAANHSVASILPRFEQVFASAAAKHAGARK